MPYIGNIVQDFSVNTAMLNSDSVTSIKIADGTIVNADINASAAIDVSKLSGVLPLAGGTLTGDLTIPDKLIHSGDTDTSIRFPTGNVIAAETGGSERLRLDSAGRVLYGKTSNRQTRLGGNSFSPNIQIEGSSIGSVSFARFNDNTSPFRFIIQKARGSIASPAAVLNNDLAGQILFSAYDGSEFCNVARIDSEVDGTPGTDDMPGNLIFSTTADGANAVTERMRITSSGDIGIGTDSPAAKLHVGGSGTTSLRVQNTDDGTAALTLGNTGSSNLVISQTSANATFSIGGSDYVRITSGGNVGIGTLSPQSDLVVRGSTPQFTLEPTADTQTCRLQFCTTDGTIKTSIQGGGSLDTAVRVIQASSESVRIDTSGNVGIATNSPQNRLHQSVSDSGANYHQFTNSTTGGGASQGIIVGISATEEGIFYNRENQALRFGTDNTERMRIASDGDVGIGTNSPDRKLHVASSFIRVSDGYGLDSSGSTERVILDNGFISFTTNSGERMRITSGGNVGIGTTSPTAALEVIDGDSGRSYNVTSSTELVVERNGNCFMAIIGTNTSNTVLNFGDAADENAGAIDYDHDDDAMRFRVNAGTRMKISSNGAIGAPSGSNIHSVSDSRLKKNVVTLDKGLSAIKALRPVSFNWIDGYLEEEKNTLYGFIAQEVESVDNNLIQLFSSNSVTVGEQTIDNPLTVNEKFIIPMLVKAVQELSAKVTALEAA